MSFNKIKKLQKTILVDSYPKIWNFKKSINSTLFDLDGHKYLDFHGGFGSNPIGWNHPVLIEKMEEEPMSLYVNKPANSDFYSTKLVEYVDKMNTTLPKGYDKLFFIDGGSNAVENALKVAFDWKYKMFKKYFDNKGSYNPKIIYLENCFHGRGGYTMSLTNTDPKKVALFPKFNNWIRIKNKTSRTYGLSHQDTFISTKNYPKYDKCNKLIDDIEREGKVNIVKEFLDIEKYNDLRDIAAVIVEPIRCEGGDIYPTLSSLRFINDYCKNNDILFIVDEVQTGFGTTGKWWCFEHFNHLNPDIVSFGKKSQQCGIFAGRRIDYVENNCFAQSSRISSTWGGNLIDMVRATHIIDIINDDNLLNNAKMLGNYWTNEMHQLPTIYKQYISNIRNLGLLMAFDLPSNESRNKVLKEMENNGLLALGCGRKTIRLRPNLAVDIEDIEECIDITKKSIESIIR